MNKNVTHREILKYFCMAYILLLYFFIVATTMAMETTSDAIENAVLR